MTQVKVTQYQGLLEDFIFSRSLRDKSVQNYRQVLNRLQTAVNSPVDELDRMTLLEWRKRELTKGLSPISWNNYVRHLKAIFNHGINYGLLVYETNPFNELSVTEPKKRKRTLTDQVLVKTRLLLEDLEYQENKRGNKAGRIHPVWFWRCVVETLYHTGMRPNQLLHLRVKDMDLTNKYFHIRIEGSKTWREYNVPICSDLIPWLKGLQINAMVRDFAENDQLFNINRFSLSKRHKAEQMNAYQVSKVFQEISEKVGSKVTPVRFRHTLGTELMKTPERNLHLVKELFGHTNVKTTLGYVEADMESIRAVLEARSAVRFGF